MTKAKQRITSVLLILTLVMTMFTMSTMPASAATQKIKLTAKAAGQTQAVLTWNKISKPYNGYAVFRDGKVIKHLSKTATKYTDKKLAAGSTHTYQIKSYKATKKTQWYNKKTKKWQTSKPVKKYRGASKKVTVYSYKTQSNIVRIKTQLPSYTITFIDGTDDSVIKKVTAKKGTNVKPPAAPDHDGYTFTGWDSKLYNKISANRKITALYAKNAYTVFFIDSVTGDTISTETVEHEGTVEFPEAPYHDGYEFTGWSAEETAPVTSDTTITANYSKTINEYTVTFTDGLTGQEITHMTVTEGNDAVPPVPPVHEGYTFTGWDSADYQNVQASAAITALYTETVVEPPVVEPETTYTYKFVDSITGATITEGEIAEHGRLTRPAAPAHDGLTFTGWDVSDESMNDVTQNLVINTIYEERQPQTFTVTFVNSVTKESVQQTVSEGESATPPEEPAELGREYTNKANFKYYFTGWNSEDHKNVKHDATITTVYSYEELYCITFYDELDSLEHEWDVSSYYRKGTPIQSIPKPELNSHTVFWSI